MKHLLDTNTCIAYLKDHPVVVPRLLHKRPNALYICAPVKAELLYGARKSQQSARNLLRLEQFFSPFQSFAFDEVCLTAYAEIRTDLERAGTPIGPIDLIIAAIAKTHDLTLVTNNTGEFSRVSGLKLEDWTQQETP